MRPIIIGEAPSRLHCPRGPLSGKSGQRLAALCELDLGEFLALFERRNVLPAFPGPAGKGSAFPMAQARARAARMRLAFPARPAVLLGGRVARAFCLDLPPLSWSGNVAVCPHPSGVSRWWNDPANVEAARAFWQDLVKRTRP